MDASNWIGLGVLVVAIAGLFRVSFLQARKNRDQIDKRSNLMQMRIAEIELTGKELDKEIRRLETEMVKMKGQHEKEIRELKVDFVTQLNEIVRQDREDHRILFEKLDQFTREITEAATLIKSHVKRVE